MAARRRSRLPPRLAGRTGGASQALPSRRRRRPQRQAHRRTHTHRTGTPRRNHPRRGRTPRPRPARARRPTRLIGEVQSGAVRPSPQYARAGGRGQAVRAGYAAKATSTAQVGAEPARRRSRYQERLSLRSRTAGASMADPGRRSQAALGPCPKFGGAGRRGQAVRPTEKGPPASPPAPRRPEGRRMPSRRTRRYLCALDPSPKYDRPRDRGQAVQKKESGAEPPHSKVPRLDPAFTLTLTGTRTGRTSRSGTARTSGTAPSNNPSHTARKPGRRSGHRASGTPGHSSWGRPG